MFTLGCACVKFFDLSSITCNFSEVKRNDIDMFINMYHQTEKVISPQNEILTYAKLYIKVFAFFV